MSGQFFFSVSEVDVGAAAVVFAHSCVASQQKVKRVKCKSAAADPLHVCATRPQESLEIDLLLAPPVVS